MLPHILDVSAEQISLHCGGSRNLNHLYDQLTFTRPNQPFKNCAIFLIDNILTASGHFRACQNKISHSYPSVLIYEVFFGKNRP